jgi:hypothetical protein
VEPSPASSDLISCFLLPAQTTSSPIQQHESAARAGTSTTAGLYSANHNTAVAAPPSRIPPSPKGISSACMCARKQRNESRKPRTSGRSRTWTRYHNFLHAFSVAGFGSAILASLFHVSSFLDTGLMMLITLGTPNLFGQGCSLGLRHVDPPRLLQIRHSEAYRRFDAA